MNLIKLQIATHLLDSSRTFQRLIIGSWILVLAAMLSADWIAGRDYFLTMLYFLFGLCAVVTSDFIAVNDLVVLFLGVLFILLVCERIFKGTRFFLSKAWKGLISVFFTCLLWLSMLAYLMSLLSEIDTCRIATVLVAPVWFFLRAPDWRSIGRNVFFLGIAAILSIALTSRFTGDSMVFAFYSLLVITGGFVFKKHADSFLKKTSLVKTALFLLFVSAICFLKYELNIYAARIDTDRLEVLYDPDIGKRFNIHRHYLYDVKALPNEDSILFSNREGGVIGRISLTSKEVRFSKPLFHGIELLQPLIKHNRIVTSLRPGTYSGRNYLDTPKISFVRLDTLEKTKDCWMPEEFSGLTVGTDEDHLAAILDDTQDNILYWIDVEDCGVVKLSAFTSYPAQVLCSPKIGKCYIDTLFFGYLYEVTVKDSMPVSSRRLFLGLFMLDMELDEAHDHLFIARPMAGSIDVVDTKTFRRIDRIPCETFVRAITYIPELDLLVAARYYSGEVQVLDVSEKKEVARFRLGRLIHESIWDAKQKSLFFVDIDSVYALSQENLEKMIKEQKRG